MYSSLRFPKDGVIIYVELHDQGQELLLESESRSTMAVPILGLFQTTDHNGIKEVFNDSHNSKIALGKENIEKNNMKDQANIVPGRIVVYGDSNCIDDSHLQKRMLLLLYP